MTEELSGRRVVVPETRELGQLVRMLEELGADTVSCPMIAIRDVPDAAPVEAWLRRFADGTCDDLVLMTGEGLRRLLGFARRIDLESAFIAALAPDTQDYTWAKASPCAARDRIGCRRARRRTHDRRRYRGAGTA